MEQQLTFFPAILPVLFLISIFWRTWKKLKIDDSSQNLPPGPWKLPVIGNIHQLLGSLPHHRLTELAKTYGPVMQLQIGEIPTVIISSPEAAKEVLKTNEISFVERPDLLVASIVFYKYKDIAFAPYGEYWKEMRNICILELFSPKRVRSFKSIREEEVSNCIRSISSSVGIPINISEVMFSLTNGIITRTTIGRKCTPQEAFMPVITELMKAIGGMNIVDVFPSSKFLYMISRTRSTLGRLHQQGDKILENIIDERRAEGKLATKNGENEVEDLLDVLLNLQRQGNLGFSLTTSSIKAIILEMFSGGSDTSSVALEWAMSEMMKNPSVMEKAQKEVRQVFSNAKNVDETRLHELKFLKSIVKETLRLHPPAPFVPRACGKRCRINGYDIEAKSKVLINAWAIGRDPNYWIEPEKFYPERFLNSSDVDYKGNNFEFIPFGSGKRICPGMLFGMINVEFPLAQLLYHFDWKLPDRMKPENLDMTEAFGGGVKRKRQLHLIPIPYCRP